MPPPAPPRGDPAPELEYNPPLPPDTPGDPMTPAEVRAIPLLADVSEDLLNRNRAYIREHLLKPGDVICKQGDEGISAFLLVDGQAEVYLSKDSPRAKHARQARQVSTDSPFDLPAGKGHATLSAGQIFGELACLNQTPRSATVTARSPCRVIEIYRNLFSVIRRSPSLRKQAEEDYKKHALISHLQQHPFFTHLNRDQLIELRDSASLQSFSDGRLILEEGKTNQLGLLLIRLGQVRVWRTVLDQRLTLAYLGRGDCFGEVELILKRGCIANCTAHGHSPPRRGTLGKGPVTQTIETEVVIFDRPVIERLLESDASLRARLTQLAEERVGKSAHSLALQRDPNAPTPTAAPRESTSLIESKEAQQIRHAEKALLIDLEKCTRCDQCVQACVASHPEGVSRLAREGPRYDKYLLPSRCQMCFDPLCIVNCPVTAIHRRDDLSIHVHDWCIGCGLCARQCPYEAIQMHQRASLADRSPSWLLEASKAFSLLGMAIKPDLEAGFVPVVCDQCRHLPQGPACVYACPHDAAFTVNGADFLGQPVKLTSRGWSITM